MYSSLMPGFWIRWLFLMAHQQVINPDWGVRVWGKEMYPEVTSVVSSCYVSLVLSHSRRIRMFMFFGGGDVKLLIYLVF